jgi:NAD(P)-dependent dehydrogenase (short-subunit alcohol dehydrogenase family)
VFLPFSFVAASLVCCQLATMRLLEGRVAIVTGAGRGLGRCHAVALAKAGAAVVINDVGAAVEGHGTNTRFADEAVAEITAMGGRAVANTASVADWQAARSMVEQAVDCFGQLDIIVNNAGIFAPASITDITEEHWDREIAVHLKGTAALTHWAAAYWQKQGRAEHRAIVNTSSPVGLHPMPNGSPYNAAKAGIAALTQTHAQELAALGVRVNAIAPAARTRMVLSSPDVDKLMPQTNGFDRHLPEHVSPLVVYLASALCVFTGRIFAVEGGDVALYQPWHAEHLASAGDATWDVEELSRALGELPVQTDIQAFYPGGRIKTKSPANFVLKALRGAGQ